MLGYADESGEPGIKKNGHDYFVFCIVFLEGHEQATRYSETFSAFRKTHGLPAEHEFHYATDSKKTRAEFIKLIGKLDFTFVSVSIKKDSSKNTASFARMAELVLTLLEKLSIDATVLMDINPGLYSQLRNNKKKYNISLHLAERKSQSSDFIQLADYVTALYARRQKYPQKAKVAQAFGAIAKKMIGSISI